MRRLLRAALAAIPVAVLLAACSSGPTSGKVTAWTWTPPTVQTVNMSCELYSGSKTSQMCIDWNTAQMPDPQDCKLTFTSGGSTGTAHLDIDETACKALLGQDYPPSGTSPASS